MKPPVNPLPAQQQETVTSAAKSSLTVVDDQSSTKIWLKTLKDKAREKLVEAILTGFFLLISGIAYKVLVIPERGSKPLDECIRLIVDQNHWFFIFALLLAFFGLFLLAVTALVMQGRSHRRQSIELRTKLATLDKELQTSQNLGLINYIPVAKYTRDKPIEVVPELQQQAAQQIISVVGSGVATVDMLLVTGYKVIGTKKAEGFLVPLLKGQPHACRYNIFLVDPEYRSRMFHERAQRLGMTVERCFEGVHEVVEHLKALKASHNLNVRVWFYREDPIYQMFKTSNEIWFQSVVSFRTENSPLCGVRSTDYSLYWSLAEYWSRFWRLYAEGDSTEINLARYKRGRSASSRTTPQGKHNNLRR